MSNLKRRNWAVFLTIMALVGLLFAITMIRIKQGVEAGLEQRAEQSQQPQ